MSFGPSTTNKALAAFLDSMIDGSEGRFTPEEFAAIAEAAERIGEIISEDDEDEED